MLDSAPNLNHFWSALIVEELVRCAAGVFCLSPGSRSTPAATAVAQNAAARSVVHFDERGAGFHALGWASATGRPAVLVCTSGTAAANYWPAVVEAAQSQIPLILLTADRPSELLACGANQAVDQAKLFGDYVRWRFGLPCPDVRIPPEVLLTTVDHAVYRACRAPAGPVHLNCMFREPLAPVDDGADLAAYGASLGPWRESRRPYTCWEEGGTGLAPVVADHGQDAHATSAVLETVQRARRGLILVGLLRQQEEVDAVRGLARALDWSVFPDVASGLRLGGIEGNVVAHYDQLLLSDSFRGLCAPDVVLHLGGPMTSKRVIEHLAAKRPEYVRVAGHPERVDPLHRVTRRIEMDVAVFARWLAASAPGAADAAWCDALRRANRAAAAAIAAWERDRDELDEIAVARLVPELLPEGAAIFCGNSMPIRDLDMYAPGDGAAVRVFANRGASGIDGNIATAAGVARALQGPMAAVIGDLAALHDLNSLALLRGMDTPFILVIVNNDGGGIFSFLPVAEYPDHFERFFAAPHGLCFRDAAGLFGLGYCNPRTKADFEVAFRSALEAGGAVIIEVNTKRDENLVVHRALQAEIAAVTDGACMTNA